MGPRWRQDEDALQDVLLRELVRDPGAVQAAISSVSHCESATILAELALQRRSEIRGRLSELRRRTRSHGTTFLGTEGERVIEPASQEDAPDERLVAQERDEQVHRVLAELPQRQFQAIDLRYMQGYSLREVAVQLQRPLGTIQSDIFRAQTRLRSIFKAIGPALA